MRDGGGEKRWCRKRRKGRGNLFVKEGMGCKGRWGRKRREGLGSV